ncbi:hypothetical protein B0A50_05083 [Salinomyces thailandicus]|uniref:Uncharacterized protein n=1 Tax=Salinomyces thailandicus TaxID=706561 RepID=A0A4U0TVK5_9PEZI|nr:hypothetical protein B0A50_05083 [Salinomyces thailandica]
MSSFFTLPASQKKRKREPPSAGAGAKRAGPVKRKEERDESISGSDISDDDVPAARKEQYESSEDEDEDETLEGEDPAAKRVRLAEQYLANTQKEVLDDVGFDAADVDAENLRRRMGERLKEDTAESRGKLYRWIADGLDWSRAERKVTRVEGKSVTAVAVQGQFVYTAGKDRAVSRWEIPSGQPPTKDGKQVGRASKKPKRVAHSAGSRREKSNRDYQQHTGAILCIAASPDGRFVATGGTDKKMIVWDAPTLKPLRVFTQHRDTVTSLAFRRGSNQLFSASRDRTVKIWSLDELAYIETLFGHQDEVVDVSALAQEKCVTVGARDRTARLWKVVEESQLVFRGGGAPSKPKRDRAAKGTAEPDLPEAKPHNEGSMDRVACIDDETFITGSDNGSLSLWNIHKKKPVFTYALAHGLEAPLPLELVSAEEHPDEAVRGEPQPRWITALRAIPFSDTFVTGSWDGCVRAWRISEDKRRIEALGPVGQEVEDVTALLEQEGIPASSLVNGALQAMQVGAQSEAGVAHGVINDLAIVDVGERGEEGVLVAAAVGTEHRLGRWSEMSEAKNRLMLFEVPRKVAGAELGEDGDEGVNGVAETNGVVGEEDFAGFD